MFATSFQARQSDRRIRLTLGSSVISAVAAAFEFAVIVLASATTGVAWHFFSYDQPGDIQTYIGVGALSGLLYTLPFVFRAEYRVDNLLSDRRTPAQVLNIWAYTFFCLAALAFMTKTTGQASRGWLALFFVFGAGTVIATDVAVRSAIRLLVKRGLVSARRLMVVGTRSDIAQFADRHSIETSGIALVSTAVLPDGSEGGAGSAGDIDGLVTAAIERARGQAVSDVMILVADEHIGRLAANIANRFMDLPVAVHIGKQPLAERFPDLQMDQIGRVRTLALRSRPLDTYQLALKRAFDLVTASLGMILLAPVFAVIAIAIKRDSRGPVFFRQRRRGFNQQEFVIWKFRTMSTMDDGDRIVQAQVNDARVTRIGRVLRRYNLDELPQLINVILGDMSLVGPRPHAVAHDRY